MALLVAEQSRHGEWLARKHGTHGRRQYRKVHLAMDTGAGDVRAIEFTSSREGDSPVLPDLLDRFPPDQQIGTVTGDGAFDTRRCHSAILERGSTAIIPIRKNGVASGRKVAPQPWPVMTFSGRPGTLAGSWKRWTGYRVRSRIAAMMRGLKSFGEKIASRSPTTPEPMDSWSG